MLTITLLAVINPFARCSSSSSSVGCVRLPGEEVAVFFPLEEVEEFFPVDGGGL